MLTIPETLTMQVFLLHFSSNFIPLLHGGTRFNTVDCRYDFPLKPLATWCLRCLGNLSKETILLRWEIIHVQVHQIKGRQFYPTSLTEPK